MTQQSPITWLIAELLSNKLMALRYDKDNKLNELIQQAKQIEKETIEKEKEKAYIQGLKDATPLF